MKCDVRRGYPVLSFYCPYWMVNKTNYYLTYRVCSPLPPATPVTVLTIKWGGGAFCCQALEVL